MNKLLSFFKILFGWPLSIIALFFLAKLIFPKYNTISSIIPSINGYLLAGGIGCFFVYFFLRVLLWHRILREKGHIIPLYEVAYLWELSELRRFIPGNIWSFLGRTVLFGEKGIDKKTLFFSMLSEAQYLLLGSLLISLLSLQFLFSTVLWNIPNKQFLTEVIIGSVLAAVVVYVLNTHVRKVHKKVELIFTILLPSFSPTKSLLLVSIATLGMFFYGFGTYLVITSFLYLNPTLVLGFIGIFVLSYIIGYVSIITPMGLGVREGVIASVLSYIFPLYSASFAAIYARLILILTEVFVFIALFVWRKTKAVRFFNYAHELFVGMLAVIYSVYFSIVTCLRYTNFYAGRFDLGNMDQTVWNTLQGHIFQFTNPNGVTIMSRLGFHADFFLVLLAPLYMLWNDPRTLLIFQTVILAMGGIVVYLLAKDILRSKNGAAFLTICYFLNPSMQYTNLYDFHAVSLATTFLLAAFYSMYKKMYGPLILFLVLAAITKEQIWVVTALFGAYVFWKHNKKIMGTIIFLVSVIFFYYLVWVAIPGARGGEHFAITYYSEFGSSPTQILKTMVLSPQKVLGLFFSYEKLHYLFQIFAPLGFLSVLSPLYLIFAGFDLAINMFSSNAQLHQIFYQYTAVITPFIFISTIFGIKKFRQQFPFVSQYILYGYIGICTLYSAYSYGPLPGAQTPNIDVFVKEKSNARAVNLFLQKVPPQQKVAATNNLGAHVSHRQYIYTIPLGMNEADMILFKIDDPYSQPPPATLKKLVDQLLQNRRYSLVYKNGDFFAFEKKATPSAVTR